MKAFMLNESLKEDLVQNYKATIAKTIYYPFGMVFMPDRFFETIVSWPKDISDEDIEVALNYIEQKKRKIKKYCLFDGPIFEENQMKGPSIIWALFDKEIYDKEGSLIDYLTPSN